MGRWVGEWVGEGMNPCGIVEFSQQQRRDRRRTKLSATDSVSHCDVRQSTTVDSRQSTVGSRHSVHALCCCVVASLCCDLSYDRRQTTNEQRTHARHGAPMDMDTYDGRSCDGSEFVFVTLTECPALPTPALPCATDMTCGITSCCTSFNSMPGFRYCITY